MSADRFNYELRISEGNKETKYEDMTDKLKLQLICVICI